MYANLDQNKLHALGITAWHPRAFKHPALTGQATLIDAQPLRINARCLVVLFYPELTPQITPEEEKIMQGMLSVLELPTEHVMLAKVYSRDPDISKLQSFIQDCSPFSVLQLSLGLPNIYMRAHYVRTFSPAHLLNNVQDKGQAYKDLLQLRKILHHASS